MVVQNVVAVVRFLAVAVLAAQGPFHHGHRRGAAGDLVVARCVAFGALHVVAAHVDVAVAVGLKKLAGQVAVLDRLGAPAVEMALPAGLAGGASHVLGDFDQIDLGIGHAGRRRRLFIGAGGVVADQAVDAGLVGEIEIGVFPSITGVAACATSLVADGAHSEVVDGGGLPCRA